MQSEGHERSGGRAAQRQGQRGRHRNTTEIANESRYGMGAGASGPAARRCYTASEWAMTMPKEAARLLEASLSHTCC